MELAGRRALVTGGGGGLGQVLVAALAERNMHVVVADVDAAAAQRVATEVGGTAVTADLSAADGSETVIEAIGEDDLDVLVNCAGGWSTTGRSYPDASLAEWDAVLTLNLRSPMRLLQGLRAPLSRSPIGAVVSISSSAGREGSAYGAPEYAVAKAGVIRLTTSLGDWADRFGVRVACVVPGWIGLKRALEEVAGLPEGERPSLIAPEAVAAQVLGLVTDGRSGGRVVAIDEGEPAAPIERSPQT